MAAREKLGTNTHSTRWEVLRILRAYGQASVGDLARQVGVKPVTIRHHLNSLQAEGLVEVEEQRQAVGRPLHLYRLTPAADWLFPQTYHLLVEELLDQIKTAFPPTVVQALIDSLVASLADEIRHEVEGLPDEVRRHRLVEWLEQHGLTARWRQSEQGLQLVKYHCPYYAVSQRHPELCQIDEALVRAVVKVEVERAACLLSGDSVCTLVLHDSSGEAVAGVLES